MLKELELLKDNVLEDSLLILVLLSELLELVTDCSVDKDVLELVVKLKNVELDDKGTSLLELENELTLVNDTEVEEVELNDELLENPKVDDVTELSLVLESVLELLVSKITVELLVEKLELDVVKLSKVLELVTVELELLLLKLLDEEESVLKETAVLEVELLESDEKLLRDEKLELVSELVLSVLLELVVNNKVDTDVEDLNTSVLELDSDKEVLELVVSLLELPEDVDNNSVDSLDKDEEYDSHILSISFLICRIDLVILVTNIRSPN